MSVDVGEVDGPILVVDGAPVSAAASVHTAHCSDCSVERDQPTPTVHWWRMCSAGDFDRTHLPSLRRALAGFAILDEPSWSARHDVATAIGVAIRAMTAQNTTSGMFDRIMTAVLLHAIEGNAAAALILAHVLRRLAINEPSFDQLGASWSATEPAGRGDRHGLAKTSAPAPGVDFDRYRILDKVDGVPSEFGAAMRIWPNK